MNTLLSLEAFCALFALSSMVYPLLLIFCIFRLNMSRLQTIIFIIASYAVYFLIQYLPYKFNHLSVFFVIGVLDLGYGYFTIKNFTEHESVITEFLSLLAISRLMTTIAFYSFAIIFPEKIHIFTDYLTYEDKSVSLFEGICFVLVYLVSIVIGWFPARFLKRMLDKLFSHLRHIGLDYILNVIAVVTFVLLFVALIILHDSYGTAMFLLSLLICVIVVSLIVLVYMYTKRLTYKMELKQLKNKCELTEKQYEILLAENDSLRKARHELNKHLSAARGLSSFQPDSEILEYISEFTDAGKHLSQLSLCGNIYIDTQIEQYYKKFKEQNVIFETVLEPMLNRDEIAYRLLLVLEEFLQFAYDDIRDKNWLRLSLRTKCSHILVCIEIGFNSRHEYNRRRFIDLIGNEMIVRQKIKQTRILAREMNGATFYNLMPEKTRLAVMIEDFNNAPNLVV